jgi:glyoxylase-like metal-dependent hydrolase (beta-lactamase superfamily II)
VIIEKLEVGPFGANCYIVADEAAGQGMVIDPGDEADRILKRVEQLGIDIKYIVLTHGHIDHVGALGSIKKAINAAVAIHAEDMPVLNDRALSTMLGIAWRPLPQIDRLLAEGDTITVGGLSFSVIHTPGHTPGGICLLGEGVLFTGDTLFNMSVGRSDFPGGSHQQLISSIKDKLLALDDDTEVYPGHGPASTIGAERRGNPFLI